MKILVTGATGFMGQHLIRALHRQKWQVDSLDSTKCDLREQGSLDRFKSTSYDIIYHLAAWTQAGDFCLHHPGEQWIINQQINTNMLTWWQRSQPQAKLVSIGTSCAYSPEQELREDNYLTGKPIESLFTYAMTKRMLYAGQLALHRQFGLTYLCLVPSTLYGSGYHTDGRQMHFIFDLIRKLLRGKYYGEDVVLWGNGYQSREIMLIDDFIQAAVLLTKQHKNDLVNIGSGEEFTIRQFAHFICELIGYDESKIIFDSTRYTGAKSKCLSINKLKTLLPDFAQTTLTQGLRRTISWFIEQKETTLPVLH